MSQPKDKYQDIWKCGRYEIFLKEADKLELYKSGLNSVNA